MDLSRSVAFGDTDQDVPMFSLVGVPVAVNPNEKLRAICETKGWKWFTSENLMNFDSLTAWIKDMKLSNNR